MTSADQHVFWITSRAAGLCALVMASLAVTAGLAIGGHLGGLRGRAAQLRALHEALSIAALVALAVHGLALLGDAYLRPSLGDILIPFAGTYRPFWTGVGIIGGYGLAALSLSYYARARIGVARWRRLHRFVALFWLLGVAHTLGAGTDAGQGWFLVLFALVVGPPLGLLVARVAGARGAAGQSSSPSPSPPEPRPERSSELAPSSPRPPSSLWRGA